MPTTIIGKSILGDLGLCQVPSKMGDQFEEQLNKIKADLPEGKKLIMTSMTGSKELSFTGSYKPKIRLYDNGLDDMFNPSLIYQFCTYGIDDLRPGADFIIWNTEEYPNIIGTTFSREAPILTFESSNGYKAIGVILRQSFIQYDEYLFSTMKDALGGKITVHLVVCNHYKYKNRYDMDVSFPTMVKKNAEKYGMDCVIGTDSEKDDNCYHRGESGNHVVAFW